MLNAIILTFVVGIVLGLVLGFASQAFYVEEDKRIEEVTKLFPGYNCGGCGYAGCSNYATALVEGDIDTISKCKPSSPVQKDAIIAYLAENPGPDGTTITVKK